MDKQAQELIDALKEPMDYVVLDMAKESYDEERAEAAALIEKLYALLENK